MALTNYTDLKASVATWLHRSDLTSEIVDFVTLGEKRLNRKLRLLQMENSDTVTLSAAADSIAFPTGFLEHIDLRYDSDDWQPTQHSIKDMHKFTDTATGRPNYYAVTSLYQFNRPADEEYSMTATYYKAWDLATDSTNWLMTNAPDAYLYATLLEAGAFIKDASRIQLWSEGLAQSINDLNRKDSMSRSKLSMRVDDGFAPQRRFDINRGY
jgi:hypothetical protein